LSVLQIKTKIDKLSYSWFQTSQTGGQWYSDTSPFSIPWLVPIMYFCYDCICFKSTKRIGFCCFNFTTKNSFEGEAFFCGKKKFYEALKTCSKIELSLIKKLATPHSTPLVNFNMSNRGTLTEGEGSVQLTS
jgi:hypothetical protein